MINGVQNYYVHLRQVTNDNNNNIVICKAHKVSSKAESEAPAVARWTAVLVGCEEDYALKGISGGESLEIIHF